MHLVLLFQRSLDQFGISFTRVHDTSFPFSFTSKEAKMAILLQDQKKLHLWQSNRPGFLILILNNNNIVMIIIMTIIIIMIMVFVIIIVIIK